MAPRPRRRILVIGGGLAGLAAAATAASKDCEVLLFEAEEKLGGLAGSFCRDGYLWDKGARAVEDSGVLKPFLRRLGLGAAVDFIPESVSLGVEGKLLTIDGDPAIRDWFALLQEFHPTRKNALVALLEETQKAVAASDTLYSGSNPLFSSLGAMLAKTLWWNLRNKGLFERISNREDSLAIPLTQLLQRLDTGEDLIRLIAQPFFPGTSVFFGLGYFRLYRDYYYPRQGMGSLAGAIENYIKGKGEKLFTGTRIESIIAENGKARGVRLQNGDTFEADSIIAAQDAKTLLRLLPHHSLPADFNEKIEQGKPGESIFTLYLEVDKDPESIRPRGLAHAIISPDRAGLALLSPEGYFTSSSIELGIPAMRNSNLAPPGKTGIIISAPASYRRWTAFAQAGGRVYTEAKEKASSMLVDALSIHMPWLKGRIENSFSASPLSPERHSSNSGGSITGWSHIPEECPSERDFRRFASSVESPIPNLYRAGHWCFTPAGIPVAIMTGTLSATMACLKLGRF